MKFGVNQLNNSSPKRFVMWVRIYTASAAAFMAWMPTADYIGQNFQNISTSIIGLTVTISNIILPFFGESVQDDKKENV